MQEGALRNHSLANDEFSLRLFLIAFSLVPLDVFE